MRILIVDDDPKGLYMLEAMLKGYGHEVVAAENGRIALELANVNPPELIISDILMPVMDGYKLCQEWKKDSKLKKIPFIFYTATYTDLKDEKYAQSLGTDRFIIKPMEPQKFMEIIDEVIETQKAGKYGVPREPMIDEAATLKGHYERMAKKLEHKMAQIEIEIAERKRSEERIVHLNAVLQAIRNVNQLITKVKDRERLLQGTCDNFIKIRGYNSAWIALIEEGDVGFIAAVQAGAEDGFSAMVDGLKRGELTRCMHLAVDQSGVLVVAEPALECGDCPLVGIYAGKARLIARLKHEGRNYGFITVTVSVGMDVDEKERRLFEDVAGDIAFALHSLELEEKRKQAEEALRKSEERFRTIFDSINDAVFIHDVETGAILDVNSTMCEMYGYSREEVDQLDVQALSSGEVPYTQQDALRWMKKAVAGKPQVFEWMGKHKSGHLFWEEVSMKKAVVGLQEHLLVVVRDITERKRAEEALRQKTEEQKALLSTIPAFVYFKTMNGNYIAANKTFADMTGTSVDEIAGKTDYDFFPKEEADFYRKCDQEVMESGEPKYNIEEPVSGADGKKMWVSTSKTPFFDSDGNVIGMVGLTLDITERKKLEAQLRQSQKMEAIGTLAGGVAHDFNNLLTVIIGNTQLVLMDAGKNESLRKKIEEIEKAGDKAASLTRQLLAFSRKQMIKPNVLDLNEEINETRKMLKRIIGEDIEFQTVLGPELWKVYADSGQINQVIINLMVNARDAMPQGGKLTIETANADLDKNYFRERGIKKTPGPYVILAVSDTGNGMDKETQEHIFEPFFTTKEVGKGTGLGLSTVYGIVKQNNGFIWVYSEPGQGTTFKVYLPEAEGDADSEEKQRLPVIELGGSETILIVEDDEGLRKFAQNALQQHGYKVLDAENGEDALRVSEAHDGQIDLMITDVVMPRMGGREAAERLQPFYPRMKVIYMSGYTDNAIVHHGVLAPGLNFLQKPFSAEGLARKVREALGSEK